MGMDVSSTSSCDGEISKKSVSDSNSNVEELGSIRIVKKLSVVNSIEVKNLGGDGSLSTINAKDIDVAYLLHRMRLVAKLIEFARFDEDLNPDLIVSQEKLNKMKNKYGLPPNVEVKLPWIREKADSPNEDWVYFYTFIFKFSFKFPITKFVKEIIIYYNLAPTQLMPNAWRILLGIEVLAERLGIEFLMSEFINCYSLVENNDDLSRYLFRSQHKYSIINDSSTINKLWKSKYIFVRGFIEVSWSS